MECLNFSVGCFLLVIRHPTLGDELLMDALGNFILELLSLIKDLVSEFKVLDIFPLLHCLGDCFGFFDGIVYSWLFHKLVNFFKNIVIQMN